MRARIIITLATVVIGLAWILPNFVDFDKKSWWPSKDKIVYGLDIQGGLHLVLGVDVEEVMTEKTLRLAKNIDADMKKEKVAFNNVEVNSESNVEVFINVNGPSDIPGIQSYLKKFYVNTLQVTSTEGGKMTLRYLDPVITNYKSQVIEQAIEVIRNRVDEYGVSEPSISAQGDSRILVQLPGVKDSARAKELIHRTARLDFRIVNEEADLEVIFKSIKEAEEKGGYSLGKDGLGYAAYVKRINKDIQDKLPKDHLVLFQKSPNAAKLEVGKIPYLVQRQSSLGGDLLNDAYVSRGQYNEPEVAFNFNVEGRRLFAELTGNNVGKKMAIVLDQVIQSAPNIQGKIDSASARITLGSSNYQETMNEARFIATALRAGALPAKLEQLEERTVGPTLGADSISKGKTAGMIAGVMVIFFMLIWYKSLGVFANIALSINLLLMLAVLTSLGATLTLPGVAGIVLTLGMAVDANVIIFERIKEELRKGAKFQVAMKDGYGHAFSAIFDANITTAAVCVVLMYFGTGAVRGFAVTLICGIATSMFTAIFVSRTLMEIWVKKFNYSFSAK
ncbi:MAG: protein translocase subunit SecD [Bdellovibrionaceae bacterium]|nr:protein translocase subunit SecD [Pseudobdellovibrionaceae bacterium]